LVRGKEEGAEMEEAAKLLQEVQVETYGSMDRREKLEFILYQMKILLRREDYVRFYIVSKKVNENGLNDTSITDLKLTYFSYMAIYFNQEDKLQ
jgi:26S proteasome regulatory subunit N5